MQNLTNYDIKAVILDIDGTLVPFNSWVTLTEKLGASSDLLFKYLYDLRSQKITTAKACSLVTKMWKDTGMATKENIQKIYSNIEIYPQSIELIKYLRKKYKLCVISGTTDLYVKTITSKLEIKDFYWNTKMIFDKQDNLVSIDYKVDQDVVKYKQFLEWGKLNDINEHQAAVIGDGGSDKVLFEKLVLPILVKSNYNKNELIKYAKYTVESLIDITKIL